MAVSFGKREQKVALLVSGLVMVGFLHLLFFSPKARDYQDAYDRRAVAERDAGALKILRNQNDLVVFKQQNDVIARGYEDAVSSFGLTMNPAFIVPLFENISVTPQEIADSGLIEHALKMRRFEGMREERFAESMS